jgi:hypothetical protein
VSYLKANADRFDAVGLAKVGTPPGGCAAEPCHAAAAWRLRLVRALGQPTPRGPRPPARPPACPQMLWSFGRVGFQDEALMDVMHNVAEKLANSCDRWARRVPRPGARAWPPPP